jgi:sugar O-acyltransferase (sialic acid O-acetyltransferase NeuD family)
MAKVIIFGVKDFAELAHFYLTHDSEHEVVAFSVNQEYVPEEAIFHGLPILPFEDIETKLAPSEYHFFAPMSPQKMNRLRESIYNQIKAKGYQFVNYISSKATVFPGQIIGDNCFILEDNTIQPYTSIGNNVIMWSGNHIGHHSVIKDHVMFTSHVVLSGHCIVESHCFFGVNSTLKDGLTIAEGTFLAMGGVLTKNTEAWSVYKGNPVEKTNIPSTKMRF